VQLMPRRGAFVAEITQTEIDELFPIMAALEGAYAAETACSRLTGENIEMLRQIAPPAVRVSRRRRRKGLSAAQSPDSSRLVRDRRQCLADRHLTSNCWFAFISPSDLSHARPKSNGSEPSTSTSKSWARSSGATDRIWRTSCSRICSTPRARLRVSLCRTRPATHL